MKKFSILLGGFLLFAATLFASSVTVVSPNGGEVWKKGCPAVIQWTLTNPSSVKIELYKGNSYATTICYQTAAGASSFTWTVPWNLLTNSEYKVKITCWNTGTADYDFSDGFFTINTGEIVVNSPNGGETWQAGTTQTILYTTAGICTNLRIELWKGGVYKSLITETASPTSSFSWVIPATIQPGTDYKIKILAGTNSGTNIGPFDFSNASFAITAPVFLTVVSPNGGENWTSGNTYPITWIDGIAQNVKIELWKGGVFKSVIATSASSPFEWTIPASVVPGTDYKIKITGLTNTNSYDFSNNNFTISMGAYITVLTPNGGESWLKGCPATIEWMTTMPVSVKIELYKGNSYYQTICSQTGPNANSYTWVPPMYIPTGSEYRVKVSSIMATVSAYDFSDAFFTIKSGTITVTTPNGGESWQAGTTHPIEWSGNLCGNVRIELWKGGTYYSLISESATAPFMWTIPPTVAPGTTYKVKVMGLSNSTSYDFSDAYFSITQGNFITVKAPNGGETWYKGCPQVIRWETTTPMPVKIELYKGATYCMTICSQTTASIGSYTWTPPWTLVSGQEYKVKITSLATNVYAYDFSDGFFPIQSGSLTVNSPNGGESWAAGSTHEITYTAANICDNLRIELWRGNNYYSMIATSTPSTGTFIWAIPSTFQTGSEYKVKIIAGNNSAGTTPGVFDFSDAFFAITGPVVLTLTSPNGGENWTSGGTYPITWTDATPQNVRIELWKGSVLSTLISESAASPFEWTIPASVVPGTDYKVKVISLTNPNSFDFSNATFVIGMGNYITVTSPNGGETLIRGCSFPIEWTTTEPISVKIELYKGSTYNMTLCPQTDIGATSFAWTPSPNVINGTEYKIKVTSVTPAVSGYDFSDTFLAVAGGELTVVSPNGGEAWQAGTLHPIEWTTTLCGEVRIELWQGNAVSSVITPATGASPFQWEIPNTIVPGTEYLVKIISNSTSGTPQVFDFSDAPFEITALKSPLAEAPRITVYPNPTTDVLNVRFGQDPPASAEILLMNLRGETLMKKDDLRPAANSEAVLSVTGIPTGNYFLVVRSGGTILCRTIVGVR